MKKLLWLLISVSFISSCYAQELPLHLLKLPKGYSIEIYAHVPDARQMVLGDKNILFVSSLSAGKIYAVFPQAISGNRSVITIASNLDKPNGIAFNKGSLYVAETSRILRFGNILENLDIILPPAVLAIKLPNEKTHNWHFIRLGPDGKLYLGIGAPCNSCVSADPQIASIIRLNLDGTSLEIFASGIRNTVGFDWDPKTKNLWFTENGRDWLGDDSPPDALNVATKPGLNFGFPYCNSGVPDPDLSKSHSCKEFSGPTLKLPAHVAPLGMSFYQGKMFPEYQNQIFIAEHGSWNRSKKIGYQVIAVKIENNASHEPTVFVSGWLQGESAWGRPVDTLTMPDGSLLISDDYANVIYRVKKLE